MKRFIYTVTSLFLGLCIGNAQHADIKISDLVNKSRWFELSKEYDVLKDSIHYDYVKIMAESMLAYQFNKPTEAIEKLSDLINNHQQEIGPSAALALVYYVLEEYELLGYYDLICKKTRDLLDQLKDYPIDTTLYKEYFERNTAFVDYPTPYIKKENHNDTIPFHFRDVTTYFPDDYSTIDSLIYIPVTYHDHNYNFILDTGAPCSFFSDRMANLLNLKKVGNYENDLGYMTFIDSIQIGRITIKNIRAYIDKGGNNNRIVNVGSRNNVDAIIGLDVLRMIGEVQILFQKKIIVFPCEKTKRPFNHPNIRIDNKGLKVYSFDNKGEIDLGFDTGSKENCFYYSFFQRHMADFIHITDKQDKIGGGLPYYFTYGAVLVPSISINIFNQQIKMPNSFVAYTYDKGMDCDGNVGLNLLKLFEKVIINFEDMFMLVEP